MRGLLPVAALMLACCERSAIDPSQSLVGAKKLPSSGSLSRETIQINRGFGSTTTGLLTYELRPDDTLLVSLTHRDPGKSEDVTDAAETFRLNSELARQARIKLWRLRPETLEGIEQVIRPADCPPPPTDTFPEASVVFFAKQPDPGVADVEAGVVDVPYASTCATPMAVEARAIIQSALKSLPGSTVAAEYEKRRANITIAS